jgi:hypothetical protein
MRNLKPTNTPEFKPNRQQRRSAKGQQKANQRRANRMNEKSNGQPQPKIVGQVVVTEDDTGSIQFSGPLQDPLYCCKLLAQGAIAVADHTRRMMEQAKKNTQYIPDKVTDAPRLPAEDFESLPFDPETRPCEFHPDAIMVDTIFMGEEGDATLCQACVDELNALPEDSEARGNFIRERRKSKLILSGA